MMILVSNLFCKSGLKHLAQAYVLTSVRTCRWHQQWFESLITFSNGIKKELGAHAPLLLQNIRPNLKFSHNILISYMELAAIDIPCRNLHTTGVPDLKINAYNLIFEIWWSMGVGMFLVYLIDCVCCMESG